jgi:hypothetical protein
LLKANGVQTARIGRTKLWAHSPEVFWPQLVSELRKHVSKAARMGLKPACRLNGTSDIAWEDTLVPGHDTNIFGLFPEIRFYDYTKITARMSKPLPSNYSLTFSRAETLKSKIDTMQVLQSGGNVSAVFGKVLPAEWNGYRVVDGVSHDLRFLDDSNVIVGLVAKGKARQDKASGFVIWL